MSEQHKLPEHLVESHVQEMANKILEELKDDILLMEVKLRKAEYHELLNPDFLKQLDFRKWYSTVDVAKLFDMTDAQLRYYIRSLNEYILASDSPSSKSAYRLDYIAVIKLRMIMLLKDELKVAGIQALLGMKGNLIRSGKGKVGDRELIDNERLDSLEGHFQSMFTQLMQTGLFELNTDHDEPQLKVSEKIQDLLALAEEKKLLTDSSSFLTKDDLQAATKEYENRNKVQVEHLSEEISKLQRENDILKEKIGSLNNEKDIASVIRSRRVLEREAAEAWDKQNTGFFKRLKAREADKIKFIEEYIEEKLRKD